MEQNKLPKNIRQIGEKEDWIRVYVEDYVHTYIQRLRGLQEGGIASGILLGRKQRINGVMHLFIRGAATAEDPYWKMDGQTPGQIQAESRVYFPEMEICGFFVSSKQNRISEMEMARIFEDHFSAEYQVLFHVGNQDEEVFSYSGHGLVKLAGYYVYYEKNEEMQSYIIRQESLRVLEKQGTPGEHEESAGNRGRERKVESNGAKQDRERQSDRKQRNGKQSEAKRTPDLGERSRKGNIPDTGPEKWIRKKAAFSEKSGKEKDGKTQIKKGDRIVRGVSIAGIFILAFLLFSDQVKFSQFRDNATIEKGILGSILEESAVPAGADSSYVLGESAESENGASENDPSILNSAKTSNSAGNLAKESDLDKNSAKESNSDRDLAKESNSNGNSVKESDSSGNLAKEGNSDGDLAKENDSDGTVAKESNSSGNLAKDSNSNRNLAKTSDLDGNIAQSGKKEENAVSGNKTAVGSSYVFPLRYLVKKGDSLYSISERYYGTTTMVDAICLENNITDPSSLQYGTILTLPAR